MLRRTSISAACAALLAIGPAAPRESGAGQPPPPRGPIATVGSRRIDEADIQRAALVLWDDPSRLKQPTVWRKKLLDLCIDRELLALEAERQGLPDNRALRHEIEVRTGIALLAEVKKRALLPAIEPTAVEIDTARLGGLFRRVKLEYILTLAERNVVNDIVTALKQGGRFDSVAVQYSIHPSSNKGGSVGWRRIGELNPAAWNALKSAKPGDLLGPYVNGGAREILRVDAVEDPDDAGIREALLRRRTMELEPRYYVDLLRKYGFQMDSSRVGAMIFASATEKVDSILASLDANGSRPVLGVHPALGVLARVRGDSVTYFDIAVPELLSRNDAGKASIGETRRLIELCSAAILPRLIARDAHERGIDRDPAVARTVRLIQDEVATGAMVSRSAPSPRDPATLRTYYDAHLSRYRRPAARRALVAMFATADSARAALRAWNGIGFGESTLIANGFHRQERATASSLLAQYYAEVPLFETDNDPLSLAVRALGEGQISPVVETPHGYGLATILGREAARTLTFAEAAPRVVLDCGEERQNQWVTQELERLRAATPAQRIATRLEAVRLGGGPDAGGKRR